MNNFEFCNPVKVAFGKGTIARLPALIPEGLKVLVVYGGGSIRKNGVYEQVVDALKSFQWLEFFGIEANPHYETCMQVVELVRKEKIGFLLAVGGGSVIDATKFIAAAVPFEGDPWDILAKGSHVKEAMPLGAVLTLAATGSEMNERAVISRISIGKKLNFTTPVVFPKFAVMDPEVTYSLPAYQVAIGVVDSFIHVIEQYLTYPVNAKVQDAFSESLMKIIVGEGRKVLGDPLNYDIRANLMWAATNALNGWIGQGAPQDWSSHRIGYALTAQFGLAHAETLAIILPGVMEYMRKEKQEKILQLGAAVFNITEGSPDECVSKTIEVVESFFRDMGLKTRLNEYEIKESALDKLIEPIAQMGWKLGEHGDIDATVAREILRLRL
ncbi:MAG: iron-containing alcohol dehydrogenase [Tannerellaceae bacterium]|jgi:NADP-dependent alcohol dehydrogenase|nr:iron-containing alcohol dehydrogenase [Tannerellaceae bacterium]